jgi:hypothetical protein
MGLSTSVSRTLLLLIRDKLSSNLPNLIGYYDSEAGLGRWLEEKLLTLSLTIGKRGNNQLIE